MSHHQLSRSMGELRFRQRAIIMDATSAICMVFVLSLCLQVAESTVYDAAQLYKPSSNPWPRPDCDPFASLRSTVPISLDTDLGTFPFVVAAYGQQLLETPIQYRINNALATVVWDALAPFHPTAVPINVAANAVPRRPAAEHTVRNRNIALSYALFRLAEGILPSAVPDLKMLMGALGLDASIRNKTKVQPAGIGNLAAAATLAALRADGFNAAGSLSGMYNVKPFQDYTGYVPVNTVGPLWTG